MRKTIFLSLLFLFSVAFCQELNESTNQTLTNESLTSPWYGEYYGKIVAGDNYTLIALIIGLTLAYLIGKFAFKFIKIAIIILLIILILRIIF